jgi:hypothetical protein
MVRVFLFASAAALADPEQLLFTAAGVLTGGTRRAASYRPFLNAFASSILAASAVALSGPIPGIAPREITDVVNR